MKKEKKGWGEAVDELFKTTPKIKEVCTDGSVIFEDTSTILTIDGDHRYGSVVSATPLETLVYHSEFDRVDERVAALEVEVAKVHGLLSGEEKKQTMKEMEDGMIGALKAIDEESLAKYKGDIGGEWISGLAPADAGRRAVIRGAQMGAAWVIARIRQAGIYEDEHVFENRLLMGILKACEAEWAISEKFENKS